MSDILYRKPTDEDYKKAGLGCYGIRNWIFFVLMVVALCPVLLFIVLIKLLFVESDLVIKIVLIYIVITTPTFILYGYYNDFLPSKRSLEKFNHLEEICRIENEV